MRRHQFIAGAVALLSVAGVVSVPTWASAATTAAQIRSASSAQLYGNGQYNPPTSEAAKNATALATTDPAGARAAATIAKYPVATWLGEWTTGAALTRTLDQATAGAAANGTTAIFVTYAIPQRDCGGYSAGGFDEASYDAWVDQIVARLAGKRAAVVVEPDALAMLSNAACTTVLDQQRYRILSREVAAFTAAGIPAYLDAGNSNWVQPAVIAARLNSAGVQGARGFFTNVANYYPTAQEQAYAQKVSSLTGGSHYVIDTSRNGQGWRGTWCNGPGAGLGTTPRVVTDGTALDALLWVKTPGASDGTCGGAPAAGKWWSAYAQALVANAALGAPPAVRAPVGTLDAATGGTRAVRVQGWAYDQHDTAATVDVRVSVDGSVVSTLAADGPRQDIDDDYGVGADHGYDATVAVAASGPASGVRSVCVTAVGAATGADRRLGCEDVVVYGDDPVVRIDRATVVRAGIDVTGWAADPDAGTAPVAVDLTVDGKRVRSVTTTIDRPDVSAPTGSGTRHGYRTVVPAAAGQHTVCAVARNQGAGADVRSTCSTLTVAASAPWGSLESVSALSYHRTTVTGWVFDRDAIARGLTVRVTVDGRPSTTVLTADASRPDVDATWGSGPAHGFSGRIPSSSGTHTFCVTAVGAGSGGDKALGCRTVRVP
ncbi:glycoside hydrolase family 6 protein [Curtobacterium sp. MCLR17_007]|uniref:glycoside hydrolase family 6 protein n=1 Tax=Curtobacterium sp. MCLR17_007 TaxID=2175648 RepID=UPI000DA91DE9|nr:glycoside hydrolase family 6 protein [Curtobacterium sp. MCLR17_007]WIB59102.1 glycoside hydrolase family 6 protein [Curtobacterium sp. MCLR17_007]